MSASVLADAERYGNAQQVEAIADEHVSVEEMQESLANYRKCLDVTSWRLANVTPDPVGGEPLFQYEVVPDSPGSDPNEFDRCDRETHAFVDLFAQTLQPRGPMDPAVRAKSLACLQRKGIETKDSDRTSVQVFITAGKANVEGTERCIREAVTSEFPSLAELTIAIPPEVADDADG